MTMRPCPAEHPRLPRGVPWMALGNLELLDTPRIEPVILSRALAPDALGQAIARLLEAARAGAAFVGGFVSPGECAAARRLAAEVPKAPIVRLLTHPIARYRPNPAAAARIAGGRTLILSGHPRGDGRLTRAACVANNRWALAIAGRAPEDATPAPLPLAERAHPAPDAGDPAAIFL